jgi:hypothetical protein
MTAIEQIKVGAIEVQAGGNGSPSRAFYCATMTVL